MKVAAIASEVILPKQRTESLVVATERGSSEDKKKSIDSVNEHVRKNGSVEQSNYLRK